MSDVPHLEGHDLHGRSLGFSMMGRTEQELAYLVAIDVGWARASTQVSTYLYGPPSGLFEDLARSWRGWDGVKEWEDLEHRMYLSATCDRTGHITVEVKMRDASYSGRAELPLYLEAGALESISRRVSEFFEAARPDASLARTR